MRPATNPPFICYLRAAFHSVSASFAAFMRGQIASLQSVAAAVSHSVTSLPRNNASCLCVCVMKAELHCDWQRLLCCIKPEATEATEATEAVLS